MTEHFKPEAPAYEVLNTEHCFKGFYGVDLLQVRYRRFSGEMGRSVSRELFLHHSSVCLLPYDARRDKVVLIEQFRVGAIGRVDNPWLLELVAGLLDKPDEPVEEAARREAEEEAGLELGRLWLINKCLTSPGCTNEYAHIYLGECDSSKASGVHGLVEEDEDIRVHVLDFDEALQAVLKGEMPSAPCMLAIYWLASNRDRVREAWA